MATLTPVTLTTGEDVEVSVNLAERYSFAVSNLTQLNAELAEVLAPAPKAKAAAKVVEPEPAPEPEPVLEVEPELESGE